MKELDIKSSIGTSKIIVGESLKNVSQYMPNDKKIVIITDSNVHKLYGHQFPQGTVIEIGTGENNKTLDTIKDIIGQMLELELDRTSFVLGIGGGIVCDITGFVASIFMRGIDFGFVSTTLLAQVDASVGGKNGVNFDGFKNMVGVFGLPKFVICDTAMLQTLPREEVLSGLAEIVKHGAIASNELFTYIEENVEKSLQLDPIVIDHFVYESNLIKSTVVNGDAREKGERRKLNFGHTFGHAIEKVTKISHGKAVSIGMVVAAELSVKKGLMQKSESDRLRNVLKRMELPIDTAGLDKDKALEAMKHDKKRDGDSVHFILLENIGKAQIQGITFDELKTIIDDLCSTPGK
jgi:3-dehydroquinate synthase